MFLLILPLNIYTYIRIYTYIMKRKVSSLEIIRWRWSYAFGARLNARTHCTTPHTHTHTTFRQFRQFLDMYRYFFSLSLFSMFAYCSTYRYVLFFIKSIDPPSPPLLHAILHVYYSPRINIKYFTLLGNVAATMVRGIIIIQQRRKGKNFGNRRLIRWTR